MSTSSSRNACKKLSQIYLHIRQTGKCNQNRNYEAGGVTSVKRLNSQKTSLIFPCTSDRSAWNLNLFWNKKVETFSHTFNKNGLSFIDFIFSSYFKTPFNVFLLFLKTIPCGPSIIYIRLF